MNTTISNLISSLSLTQKIVFAREKLASYVTNTKALFTQIFTQSRVKTLEFTIGAVGVSGCDFNFATAANTTAQPIDLGAIIPAYARIVDVVVKTSTTFAGTGLTNMGVTIGTTSGGTEIASSADLITANAINQCAVGAGFTWIAITAAAKHVFIGGTPTGANWAAVTAGKLTVYVTYIDNVNA